MKRTLLAAAAATVLAVTGCSSGESGPEAAPEPAAPSAASQTGPIELEIGETANLTKSVNGPRDIDVTVTDISVATECRHGLNDWHDDYTHEGGYFVQVSGGIDVRSSPQDFSVPQWAAADADRNVIEVAPASECAETDEAGVQTFNDLVMPGTKAKAVEEYWVDTLPSYWFLNEPSEDHAFSWPVPQDVTGSTPASGTTTPEPSAAALATNDCLVGSYGQPQFQGTQCLDKTVSSCGDPATMESGTTFFTDGTSGWTQQCANEMYPQQVEMRQQNLPPNTQSNDDFAGPFEPAGTPPAESLPQGWHCEGPAYQCRDDDASGKTEGQQNWTP